MKTNTKSIFAVLATLFAANVTLAEDPANAPKKKSFAMGMYASANAEKMNLTIENYAAKPLTITLKDKSGTVLYTEVVKKNTPKYWRKFDVSDLTANCKVEVSDGSETISQEFEANQTTPVSSSIEMGLYQVKDSQTMNVMIENNGDKATELNLKSDNGEILYSETINKNIKKYSRKFNMSNLPVGNYHFEAASGLDKTSKEVGIGQ
jgi:hypothetical protein